MGGFVSSFDGNTKRSLINGLGYLETGLIFALPSIQTIGNTVTETTVLGTPGTGYTLTIPANYAQVGTTIYINLMGIISGVIANTAQLKTYFGATAISDTTAIAFLAGLTNIPFEFETTIEFASLGAGGSVRVNSIMWFASLSQTGIAAAPATTVINTTIAQTLDQKITFGTAAAGNTISVSTGYVTVMA